MRSLTTGDPERLGPYRLVGVLGGGGMGRVYLARSAGGRTVAVKTARPELADDPHFRRRFAREVAAARLVGGPFVAPVVDAEPDGDPPWMATAYVPGISLTDAVTDHGPLPADTVRLLAAGLARALTALHARGLVHRDLKSSNVLLAADGPRVIDFGIAHSAAHSALTHTGMALGTPGYMAPEQVSSDGPPVSGATDVFALGGVVVHALTGRGPYGSADPQVLMYRTVHEEPRVDHLPPGLRELARECLARDPESRPSLTRIEDRHGPAGPYTGWLPVPVTRALLTLASDILESDGGTNDPPAPMPGPGHGGDQDGRERPGAGSGSGPDAGSDSGSDSGPGPDAYADSNSGSVVQREAEVFTAEATPEAPAAEAPPPAASAPPAPTRPIAPAATTAPAPAPAPAAPASRSAPPGGAAPRRGLSRRRALAGLSALGATGAGGGVYWALRPGAGGGGAKGVRKGPANPLGVRSGAGVSAVLFNGAVSASYVDKAGGSYEKAFGAGLVKTRQVTAVQKEVQPRLTSGDPPDLVNNSGARPLDTLALAGDGQLADLTPLLEAPSLDDPSKTVRETLRPGAVEAGVLGRRGVHVLSYAQTVYGLWYVPELLEEHGWEYPRTWDDMLALCSEAKKEGIDGWIFAGRFPQYLTFCVLPAIGQVGGRKALEAIDNLEGGAWRHDAVREVFEAYHQLGALGLVARRSSGYDHIDSQRVWARREAVFIPNGTWLEQEARPFAEEKKLSPAVGAGPAITSSDAMPYGTLWAGPSEPFLVPAEAGNPEGGMELLRRMLSGTAARDFTRSASSLSSLRNAERPADLPRGLASAHEAYEAAGRNLVNPRLGDWYPDLVRDEVGPALRDLVLGEAAPAKTVARIQKAADAAAREAPTPRRRH
ncbi:N-acetylglucosamine/diacetylchitobiose ABC transporter substrate-binding protein [Streptomyces iconiensis]|uniref:N-acetylglucosamine/diacetylchitobiose ABC transporter substrate-binding protein n=1 Tax=Streptomyces iconiensis TaxID=1384038 RepID=A0ABT6ZTA9_9ACTN|nr:N-acetylglucosamine/diacetylchitobiose ABC transporter substrate-binding protein [Streptomyces iconiensis]MDJ1132300.1 N-acetylglucosamine/diacetylchitobiose ABC transporter substrate-binding protein [Streptomyces iconiensis]